MLTQILAATPAWVFVLFAVLLAFGLSQARRRTLGLRRLIVLPMLLTALSGWGVVSAFGAQGLPLALWALTLSGVTALVAARPVPAGTVYDDWQQRFSVPGSLVPLALMMGLFATKYAAGATLALQPGLAHNAGFAAAAALLYGAFSGAFAGRALRLLRLAFSAQRGAPVVVA